MDSVDISLLTCSPGTKVWSLYGHTAIRVEDPSTGSDMVVNYGMFDFQQKNFILRFVFGLTDYQMGIVSYPEFMVEYAAQGRSVVQQKLNLTAEEKAAILQALSENYQPQNRVYRYNFFYDNCTTRARDILVSHLGGKVEYEVDPNETPSYREMTHQWNADHRWARFGNDLLLGLGADNPTDYEQQQFLPDTLRRDFAGATIVGTDGSRRPLVAETTEILKINPDNVHTTHSMWDSIPPRMLFAVVLALMLVVTGYELKRKKTFWLVDVTWLTLDGLAGLVLLAMVFSKHPTVNLNLQILLLNPLSILVVYGVVKQELSQRCHWYWKVLTACLALFLIGNFVQDYAEGMNFLALTLLLRACINISLYRKPHTA